MTRERRVNRGQRRIKNAVGGRGRTQEPAVGSSSSSYCSSSSSTVVGSSVAWWPAHISYHLWFSTPHRSESRFFACKKPIWFLNEVLGEVGAVGGAHEDARAAPKIAEPVAWRLIIQHTNTHSPAFARRTAFFDRSKKRLISSKNGPVARPVSARFGLACGSDVSGESRWLIVSVWECTLGTESPWGSSAGPAALCPPPSRRRTGTTTACWRLTTRPSPR